MNLSDTKRVALVIGAGRDQGRAAAEALGRAGLHVAAVDINPDALERSAHAIRALGGTAETHAVDVSNKMATQTMIYTVLEVHPKIDVLVCAAEIVPATPALRMDEGEWDRVFAINLKGIFLVSQTVARAMQVTGGGLIVLVVRAGQTGHAAVDAGRVALASLGHTLAQEWAPLAIRVRTVGAGADVVAHLEGH